MKKFSKQEINMLIWAVQNSQELRFHIKLKVLKNGKINTHLYYNKNCALALLGDAFKGAVELCQ